MTEKENLFLYINNPTCINENLVGGCLPVCWSNPYLAIDAVFSKEEISSMSDETVSALVKLAGRLFSALYGKGSNDLL